MTLAGAASIDGSISSDYCRRRESNDTESKEGDGGDEVDDRLHG